MRAIKRYGKRGFTLVELMIVVAIIGVLAALAIYGVRRYLASSKSAEARNSVGAISRAAVAAYERETYSNEILPDGASSTTFTHALCGSASWTPAAAPKAKKYQPSTADGADFNLGDNLNGWKCLRFSMNEATHYSYEYCTGNCSGLTTGADGTGYEADAQGDLDGNGTNSFFGRGAVVRNGSVVVSTELFIQNEYE
jgi:type IV pilus assembly protein PilA